MPHPLPPYFNLDALPGIGKVADINYLFVCTLRVDLNLSVKVGDFGFTRETNCKTSQSQKCPVKWMPPEMLQDGISTEKTDVVGCLQMVRAIYLLFFPFNNKYYTEHYKQYHSDNVINRNAVSNVYDYNLTLSLIHSKHNHQSLL